MTAAIFVYDIEAGKFVDLNRRAVDTFGYGREELLAMTIGGLSEDIPPYTETEATALIGLAMAGKPQTFEWRCKKKDGTVFWVEIGCRSTAFGGRNYLLSTLHDINLRKEAEARLVTLSQFDVLTGLANRRVFVSN